MRHLVTEASPYVGEWDLRAIFSLGKSMMVSSLCSAASIMIREDNALVWRQLLVPANLIVAGHGANAYGPA
jgi:hypothetical protein